MKIVSILIFSISIAVSGQNTVKRQLQKAVLQFLSTPKGKVSNLSFFVADEKGNTVFDFQADKGLTTASTQKIFTAAMALELLSPQYQYTTTIFTSGTVQEQTLHGDLIVQGSGDPTLGSWRYNTTRPEIFLSAITDKLHQKGISSINGNIYIDDAIFDFQTVPNGWAWQDLGNYYGAGVFGVNWRENQFELIAIGNQITKTNYAPSSIAWVNDLTTGGNSDQSTIYTAPFSTIAHISGQLPAHRQMTVAGATPNPPLQLGLELKNHLNENGIILSGEINTASMNRLLGTSKKYPHKDVLLEWKSPTMNEIVYYFLLKSINLYGESLLKTIAKEKTATSQYTSGIHLMKNYWTSKGIPEEAINFADGSGLSPKNYVSAKAEVQALLYSAKQPWFEDYFKGFPTQKNGMKMKSGTMKHTKSFAGIHTSKSGKTYYFSIIVNNYQEKDLSTPIFMMLEGLKQ